MDTLMGKFIYARIGLDYSRHKVFKIELTRDLIALHTVDELMTIEPPIYLSPRELRALIDNKTVNIGLAEYSFTN